MAMRLYIVLMVSLIVLYLLSKSLNPKIIHGDVKQKLTPTLSSKWRQPIVQNNEDLIGFSHDKKEYTTGSQLEIELLWSNEPETITIALFDYIDHVFVCSNKSSKRTNTPEGFITPVVLNLPQRIPSSEYFIILESNTGVQNLARVPIRYQQPADGHREDHSKKFAIVTVGRSGSTLLGRAFDYNPRGFYLFEPEHIYKKITHMDILSFFDCSFTFSLKRTNRAFWTRNQPLYSWYITRYNHTEPAQLFQNIHEECLNAEFRAVKVIIVPSFIGFAKISGMKVIHLVRDPRSVIASQNERKAIGWKFENAGMYSACEMMYKLSRATRQMNDSFIRTFRYEDMIEHPDEMATKLEDFLEYDLFREKSIHEILALDAHNETVSFDSTDSTMKWKKRLSPSQLSSIYQDTYCSKLLERYNYTER